MTFLANTPKWFKLSNVVASVDDDRDLIYQVMPGPYPRRAGMLKWHGTIEHQGIVGKCVGATFASVAELFMARAGQSMELAPDFIYDGARVYENRRSTPSNPKPGTQLRDGAKVMGGWGIPIESLYPSIYDDEITRDPTWECMYDARLRKAGRYEFIKERGSQWIGVEEISNAVRSAITEGCPCAIAMPITSSILRLTGPFDQQIYHVPSEHVAGSDIIGNHAMALFGYDEFGPILEGSWDVTYGDKGLIRLPWRALENVIDLIVVRTFAGFGSDDRTRMFFAEGRSAFRGWVNSMMSTPQIIIDTAIEKNVTTDDIECIMELPDGWVRNYAANDPIGKTLNWAGWL